MKRPDKGGEFTPRLSLDLLKAKQADLDELMEELQKLIKARGNKRPELPFTEGWNTITPEMSEEGLLRNVRNRRPKLQTSTYYWRQMDNGLWMPTGQPIIFDVDGNLVDGQNRFLAGYLGNVTFESFVVTSAKAIPNIFAFVDNGKPRSPAEALETAGFDGQSSLIARTIKLIQAFDARAFKKLKNDNRKMFRLSPAEYLQWVESNTDIQRIVRSASNYRDAAALAYFSEIVPFMAYKAEKLFDETVADDFLSSVNDTEQVFEEGSPIKALQVKLERNLRAREPMSTNEVLASFIKAFNAWKTGQKITKLSVDVTESMPIFVEHSRDSEAEAA